jgi:CDP-glucose 4,6-dehydratase
MADVVVTGSQGFLGRHLMKRLEQEGADVCGTYSYTLPSLSAKYRRSYFKLDVTKFEDCLKLINQENPRIVYHLVAQPIVTAGKRHPFSTFELTVRGSYNLFEAIRQTGKPIAVIVVSSDKVYGENTNAVEGDRLDGVDHPYTAAKVCEDVIAQSYAKSFGLPMAIIRSANIYGEGDFHWDRLVPSVSRDIVQNKRPVLRSNGGQKRDYIYVDDLMDGYMRVMGMMVNKKLKNGQAINFGADCYTALEVTDTLLKVSGRVDLTPEILDGAKDELLAQHINYEYAEKVLLWKPKTSLEDGLSMTYHWYEHWLKK